MKHALICLMMSSVCVTAARAAEPRPIPPIGPDELAISVENMDRGVDPGVDFYRFASGNWLDRVQRPEHLPSIGAFDFMSERLKGQMVNTIAKAAKNADGAPKGSPVQQVGDLYTSYMDVAHRCRGHEAAGAGTRTHRGS